MREYRKRKRTAKMSAPAARAFSPPIVRAPEPSRVTERIIDRPLPPPAASERWVRAAGPTQQLQNGFGTGAVFSYWGPRLTGVPVLL